MWRRRNSVCKKHNIIPFYGLTSGRCDSRVGWDWSSWLEW